MYGYTRSWSYAADLYTFLMLDIPGGTLAATYPGTSTVMATVANKGDVYFYDWQYYKPNVPHRIGHVDINVGYGTTADSPSQYGDYVDTHTNNRYHVFWTLQKYNVDNAKYTLIYAVQVSASN